MKQSNKSKGDAFRDKIKSLCLAASYSPIPELRIGDKKADIVYEVYRAPRKVKIAIEAKSYDGNISKSMVSEIVGDYLPALQRREVDEVWVVAENDFSSDARKGLDNQPGMYPLTYGEFLRTLINFPRYLEQLIIDVENDGIEAYYVEQEFESEDVASENLVAYARTGKRPIAILSSYGMGKTSLAKIVSLRLARIARNDPLAPIPILIRLGDLSSQQEMEGLLGSMFTSKNAIEGYSFALFRKLNDLGHLILILDGLDEMRHAMSWDDFQYNFKQISKILNIDSRAILLGRPNTFKTEAEYRTVLSGAKDIAGEIVQPADAIVFEVKKLKLFNEANLKDFLRLYMTWATSRHEEPPTPVKIGSRVTEITQMDFDDLISRPVHAQMLASIATDFSRELATLSRFGLYKEFVSATLTRDYDRTGGKSFKPSDRRYFLHRLAYWLWFDSSLETFRPTNINLSWLRERNRDQDQDGIRRELISGALLETKLADHFYFSHRSFHEFLVAEYILSSSLTPPRLNSTGGHLSEEIAEFVSDTDDHTALLELFEFYANKLNYDFSELLLIERITPRLQTHQLLTQEHADSPIGWYAIGRRKSKLFAQSKPEELFNHWATASHRKLESDKHNIICSLLVTSWIRYYNEHRRLGFDSTTFYQSVAVGLVRNLPIIRMRDQIKHNANVLYSITHDPMIHVFSKCCRLLRLDDGSLGVKFDAKNFLDAVVMQNAFPLLVESAAVWKGSQSVSFDDIGLPHDEEMIALRQIFARTQGNIKFVQVATR